MFEKEEVKKEQKTVVSLENVSKKFQIYQGKSNTFKEALLRRNSSKPKLKEFWALKDVSFDVKEGETFGIVGENGSGKSTALKILTKIYYPDKGKFSVVGKISGLLELGAGFHPELTGRENIYLNGSILGFSRKQIRAIFDEIVAFAELEKFIDTPVKNYSSGMYVRLGFSVAINVDPDILLIDEVLSVGDEHFQRKCSEKLIEFKRSKKTIIIVSHGLEDLRNLCDSAVWLHEGKMMAKGSTSNVIDAYLDEVNKGEQNVVESRAKSMEGKFGKRWGSGEAQITKVDFLSSDGKQKRLFKTGEGLTCRIYYKAHQKIEKPVFGIAIHTTDGVHITGPNTRQFGVNIPSIEGDGFVDYNVKNLSLLKGAYLFSAAIYDNSCTHAYDHHDEKYFFEVALGEIKETYGLVSISANWSIEKGKG